MAFVAASTSVGPAITGTPESAITATVLPSEPPCTLDLNEKKWHPYQYSTTVCLQGGYNNKPSLTVTKVLKNTDGNDLTMVRIGRTEYWIIKMSGFGGVSLKNGGKIMDRIRDAYFKAVSATGSQETQPAITDAAVDPMQELDLESPAPEEKRGRKRKSPSGDTSPNESRRNNGSALRNLDRAFSIEMPRYSKSAKPHSMETVSINVHVTSRRGTGTVWIGLKDVPWLLNYITDEIHTGSVSMDVDDAAAITDGSQDTAAAAITDDSQGTVPDESSDSQHTSTSASKDIIRRTSSSASQRYLKYLELSNCSTPGVHIRLAPARGNLDEYEAICIDGPCKGVICMTSKVSKMSQAKWDELQECASEWQCPSPDFTSVLVQQHHKVSATVKYLELAMTAKIQQAERLFDR